MSGPYETERDAIDAARPVLDLEPGTGQWQAANLALLEDACRAAGAELGAYDRRQLAWLAGWEPQVSAVFAGIIRRAAEGKNSV